jgi:hypothetical protein
MEQDQFSKDVRASKNNLASGRRQPAGGIPALWRPFAITKDCSAFPWAGKDELAH